MPEKIFPGPLRGNPCPQEAVCIHTRKVYDSCKEQECLQDLRVYLTCRSQEYLEKAVSVKAKHAELLWAHIDVEPVAFHQGYYTVEVKYYYHIQAEACGALGNSRELHGVAVCNKRTMLFGSEGKARIFSSQMECGDKDMQCCEQSNLPIAVVEVVDPVILHTRIVEPDCCDCNCNCCCEKELPAQVCERFEDPLVISDENRQLLITLGQFSIVRLERDAQVLVPAYETCLPEKKCPEYSEDPCELFQTFGFPSSAFYPPKSDAFPRLISPCRQDSCGCSNSMPIRSYGRVYRRRKCD